MTINNLIRAVAIAAVAASTACLGGESTSPEAVPIEQTTFAPALGVNLAASTKTPNGAYYRDLTVGTGAVIATGQNLTARYTVWLADGTLIESNVSNPTPLPFQFGVGATIKGFDEGLVGIRVGGKRQLIIPPSLGYGPYDYLDIPGNSVLVFTIEVVSAA